ncbi:MAG: T9SS type A sorting domain-containing protein [Bacteroidota bacterium]
MRSTFLISLICLFIGKIYSQSYTPILSEKNEWSVNSFGPGLSIDNLFLTEADTLIDSLKYFPLIWKAPATTPYPDHFMGYLTEDSANQSLSFFEADINGVVNWLDEKHLYQFNLQIGDTVFVDSKSQYPEEPFYKDTLEVESIDYQTSSNACIMNSWIRDSVKLINLKSIRANAGQENQEITWVEGSGAATFILMPAWSACGPTTVNCHHKDDILVYQSLRAQQLDTCLFSTALDQPKQYLEMRLAPNPSEASLSLSYTNPNAEERQIILRNLQGQSIWTERSRAENITINRQNWAAGIYIIEVWADGRRLGQSKIVFQ